MLHTLAPIKYFIAGTAVCHSVNIFYSAARWSANMKVAILSSGVLCATDESSDNNILYDS